MCYCNGNYQHQKQKQNEKRNKVKHEKNPWTSPPEKNSEHEPRTMQKNKITMRKKTRKH